MKSAIVFGLAFATCTPSWIGDPPPARVVDSGPITGDPATCQAACDHLKSACGIGDSCLQTCLVTAGTNIGAVIDWGCAARFTEKKDLLTCGLQVCE